MQTLLNYRIQSTSMVPLYNYNLNRNYISGYNYYPNLKMNSYIKDHTLDSSHGLNSSFTTSQNIASQMSYLEGHCDMVSEHKISAYEQYRNIMENSLNNLFLNQNYISNIHQSKEEKKNSCLELSKTNIYDNFSQFLNENRTSSKSIGIFEGVSASNEVSKFIKNERFQNTNTNKNIHTALTLERNKNNYLPTDVNQKKNVNHLGFNNMSNQLGDGSPKAVSGASVINKLLTLNAYEQDHINVKEKDLLKSLDLNKTTKLKDVPNCSKSIEQPLLNENNTISTFETQTNKSNLVPQISDKEISNLFLTKNEEMLTPMDTLNDIRFKIKDNRDKKEKTPPFGNINLHNSVQKNFLSKR